MKVTEVKSENFKKLEAIDIKLDGKTVTVQGPNGAGKSSFIDAVWIALTGKDVPAEPIRVGEKQASIEVTVKDEDGSEFIVEKQFHQRKPNALIVRQYTEEGRLGAPEKSPQAFLDNKLGKISFDPFEFIHKTPREQKKFLMDLLGLDFSEIDSKKACLLEEKKTVASDIKKLEGQFESLPKFTGDFTKEKDLSEVTAKQAEQQKARETITTKESNINRIEVDIERARLTLTQINDEIVKVKDQLKSLEERKTKGEEFHKGLFVELTNAKHDLEQVKPLAEKVLAEDITTLVTEIQEHNKKVQIVAQKNKIITETKALNKKLEDLEDELETVEDQRKAVLAASPMPDPKLSFTEDGLLYDGLPFTEEQLNHAKIIEVGIGIQMALNPKLRIMRIKDASMLDSKTLTIIKKLAVDKDYQLFIERVADTKEIGFIIEEGDESRSVSVEQAMIELQPSF